MYKGFQLPHFLTGDKDDPVRIQRNFDAIAHVLQQVIPYENVTGVPLNVIVDTNNVAWSNAVFAAADAQTAANTAQTTADGKIETFYQVAAPHPEYTNVPDNATYNNFVGNMWYDSDSTEKKTYRYNKVANGANFNYTWTYLEIPVSVFDTIDSKRTVFMAQPTIPYYVGDLWITSASASTGDFKKCITQRLTGVYTAAEWAVVIAVETVTSATNLVNTVVDERLGAQTIGFKRGSTARNQVGTIIAANLPRYGIGRFGQALMSEIDTTNQLPAPLDWATYAAKTAGTTVTADHFVIPPYSQAADLIQFPAAGNYIYKQKTGLSAITGQTWVFSAEIYVNGGNSVFIAINDALTAAETWVNKINLVNGWNKISVTRTFGATVSTNASCLLSNYDLWGGGAAGGSGDGAAASGAIDMWILWSQLEQKAYPTSFTDSTRVAEVTVVPVAGNFAKNNWTVEFTFKPTVVGMTGWLWTCVIDGSNWYRILATAAGQFQISVWTGGGGENGFTTALNPIITVGTNYSIMFSGNGSVIRACVNGVQMGADTPYTEPVGTLPTFMYLGSNVSGANQANGLIDDTRFSSTARTAAEHALAYANNVPLPVDEYTNLKQSFNSTLRQTTRNHESRPVGSFMIADRDTTANPERADFIVPSGELGDIVVNQAISELPVGGGSIVLMDGTFDVHDGIGLPDNVSLAGQGNSTILKSTPGEVNGTYGGFVYNSNVVNGKKIKIENLYVDGNKANVSGTSEVYGIWLYKASECIVNKVQISNMKTHGVVWEYMTNSFLTESIITANRNDGIFIYNSDNNTLANNIVELNGQAGIGLGTSSHNKVFGNLSQKNGQTTDNFYHNYVFYDNSDYNSIQDNTARRGTQANKPCYGLRVHTADCNNNYIRDNDLYDSGTTANYSDAGTGTDTTSTNRVA